MSALPKISVVTPTHNRRQVLPRTVASVLAQDEVDFELIIVDDASTDDTRSYLATLADPRIRVLTAARNAGVAAARNLGLDAARALWTVASFGSRISIASHPMAAAWRRILSRICAEPARLYGLSCCDSNVATATAGRVGYVP